MIDLRDRALQALPVRFRQAIERAGIGRDRFQQTRRDAHALEQFRILGGDRCWFGFDYHGGSAGKDAMGGWRPRAERPAHETGIIAEAPMLRCLD